MKIKFFSILLIICLVAFLFPGCVFISRDFRMTRDLVIDELGSAMVETEVQLQIGSGLISMGKMVVSFTDANNEALDYLRDVRNVQVGVYKLYNVDSDKPLIIPKKIGEKLANKGYQPMVKVKERDSAVWLMTKVYGKRLTSMYVISLERDELVLVEVTGRLGRLIEKAIRDHGLFKDNFIDI